MPVARPLREFPVRELVETLESIYGRVRMITRFEPMEELVSCILSQHTTDAKSFPTFTSMRAQYSEWDQLVSLGPEKLAEVIRPAGLPNQKAKSIIGCLRAIKDRTGEYSLEILRDMPLQEAMEWLTSLPGVGPKTASLVLGLSFGRPTITVDTHVFRVSWRIGLIDHEIGEGKAHSELIEIVPKDLTFRFHTSFIQHGRMTCKAPIPVCERCPVTSYCKWFKENGPLVPREKLGRTKRSK